MGDLDRYSGETLRLAFWLQEEIFEEGIEGVHFMRHARVWAEDNAADITADRISLELNRL